MSFIRCPSGSPDTTPVAVPSSGTTLTDSFSVIDVSPMYRDRVRDRVVLTSMMYAALLPDRQRPAASRLQDLRNESSGTVTLTWPPWP